MSNLAFTSTYTAVRQICAYWKNALPLDQFSTYENLEGQVVPAIFDKGEPEFAQPEPGAPWVSMRYTGPEDGGGGLQGAPVPRFLSFAIRFYHAPDPFPGDGGDPYLAAQDLCLRGESDFEAMLAANPRAGGLIIDSVLLEGVTGDMEDASGGAWYGHELLVSVQVH